MKNQCTFLISRPFPLRMRNVSDKNCIENQNTHFMLNFFFRKLCSLCDNVQKIDTAGQATDDSSGHALYMLATKCYKHTLRMCNTY
jgi:hypothetical protein